MGISTERIIKPEKWLEHFKKIKLPRTARNSNIERRIRVMPANYDPFSRYHCHIVAKYQGRTTVEVLSATGFLYKRLAPRYFIMITAAHVFNLYQSGAFESYAFL